MTSLLVKVPNIFSSHMLHIREFFQSGILGMSFNHRHIMTSTLVMAASLHNYNVSGCDSYKSGSVGYEGF
jgi:hypothetical protein